MTASTGLGPRCDEACDAAIRPYRCTDRVSLADDCVYRPGRRLERRDRDRVARFLASRSNRARRTPGRGRRSPDVDAGGPRLSAAEAPMWLNGPATGQGKAAPPLGRAASPAPDVARSGRAGPPALPPRW